MQWTIEQNTIASLHFDGEELIFPWGFETADSSAFFSLEDGVGYRYQVLFHQREFNEKEHKQRLTVKMHEGLFSLEIADKMSNASTVMRSVRLECLKPCYLMDFVLRFRFKQQHFKHASIAGRSLQHADTNLYYQYPVDLALLTGAKYRATITVKQKQHPDSLAPLLYVRDAPGEWVVHARMLPKVIDKEVIKLCNRWAKTRPLPNWLGRALLAVPSIKNALRYRGERAPFQGPFLKRMNPQGCPLVRLEKGEILYWKLSCQIRKKEDSNES